MRLDELSNPLLAARLLRQALRDPGLMAVLRVDLSRVAGRARVSAPSVARFLKGGRLRPDATARVEAALGLTAGARPRPRRELMASGRG